MSDQKPSFVQGFDTLLSNYIAQSNLENMGLMTYFEQTWPSPCYVFEYGDKSAEQDSQVAWRPILRSDMVSLVNIEQALDIVIPNALQQLFCRYYSHDINAQSEHGNLTLLQAFNEQDFDRLQKNLIAHVLMKRRLKQADTMFFALTDEDDFVLSVLLSTGEVVLEEVGKEPCRQIAPDLTSFVSQLTPLPQLVAL